MKCLPAHIEGRLTLGLGARALLLLGLFVLGGWACRRSPSIDVGAQLFAGQRPLLARLSGDDTVLPVAASRCDNCHLSAPITDAQVLATQTFGPRLSRETLLGSRPRRGGPASRYDLASFCALLRTGVDPATILVQRIMPRYEIDDASCAALWDYLRATP